MSDSLAWQGRFRLLPIIDTYTREALAIEVDISLLGTRVVQVLERLVREWGEAPLEIMMDNGPECTSKCWTSGRT